MGNPAPKLENLAPIWKPGQSGNPAGRPRGARSKLTEAVIAKLLASFEQHGDDAIERVRTHQPAAYLAACVSRLPKQQEKIESPFADLTEDELDLLETFLRSTRAKTITTIDAEATPMDANKILRDIDIAKGRTTATEAHITRAAAVKVSPQSLSDAEINERLDNALNSPKRDIA
jgi:hypothetical protein